MSVPRLRRTVAFAPSDSSRSAERLDPTQWRAGGGVAGCGIQRDQVDVRVRGEPAAQRCQFAGVAVAIVDPVDHRPLEAHATVLRIEVALACVHEVCDRIPLVDRHQLVSQRVVGGVERHRKVDRQWTIRERTDPREDADRRNRDVSCGQPEIAVEALGCGPHRVEVGHRLAHAHEHDVADATLELPGPLGGSHDLFDDLADGQVSREARLPRGAETTGHRATGLAAHTDRCPIGVQHQHGLDSAPTVSSQRNLMVSPRGSPTRSRR